jgi:hypothetical protein
MILAEVRVLNPFRNSRFVEGMAGNGRSGREGNSFSLIYKSRHIPQYSHKEGLMNYSKRTKVSRFEFDLRFSQYKTFLSEVYEGLRKTIGDC